MEKIIYDTKEKQNEREKDFVQSPKRIAIIENLLKEIVDDICDRLENDKYKDFSWGDYQAVIEFDTYYTEEYTYMSDRVQFWIANGVTSLRFYEHTYFGDVLPEEHQKKLWSVLNNTKNAIKARLPYKQYLEKIEDAKVQAEIQKADEIAEAKKVLEKYNA